MIGASQITDNLGRPIRRIIVNDNQLPLHPTKTLFKQVYKTDNIIPLIEGGDDDR
jgi:hypothetical protein